MQRSFAEIFLSLFSFYSSSDTIAVAKTLHELDLITHFDQ